MSGPVLSGRGDNLADPRVALGRWGVLGAEPGPAIVAVAQQIAPVADVFKAAAKKKCRELSGYPRKPQCFMVERQRKKSHELIERPPKWQTMQVRTAKSTS